MKILGIMGIGIVLWLLWILPDKLEYWKFRRQEKQRTAEINELEDAYRR